MKNAFRITWRARADIAELGDYIARDNPAAAERMLDRIKRRFQMVARQPLIGEARPDLRQDVRCVGEGRYVIYYRPLEPGDETVEIVRVLHGARDVGPDMF